MGSNTTVYVRILKSYSEIITVSALTCHDALEVAEKLLNVTKALCAAYERDELDDSDPV